ncbi:MAG: DEAD/DEAH box helicase [Azospirillaceae bacterium]|nr:DEAD/DEAH box helicase [Azospirillaceae bacterium]
MVSFTDLPLRPEILDALAAQGYQNPTPIQAQAVPPATEGRDILGIAQTGTGKTAAFTLPILQRLSTLPRVHADGPRAGRFRALVLTPTRELAIQIDENIASYAANLKIRHAVIFGGVGQKPQVDAVQRGLDILVATPGRMLDLMGQGHIKLDQLEVFVLDEADRMLDMGFIHDVRRVIAVLPKQRQTMFFSATMPREVSDLAMKLLRDPVRIEVTPVATTVEKVEQKVIFVPAGEKRQLLAEMLDADETMNRVIVFSRTKHGANKLTQYLEKAGVSAAAIHGNKSQSARQAALEGFREGTVRILIATDIAARGIDVDGVSHVVNYELPNVPESYVHRIGRTARAGASGIAIAFCDQGEERVFLRDIEKLTRTPLTVIPRPAARPGYQPPSIAITAQPTAAPQRHHNAAPASAARRPRNDRPGVPSRSNSDVPGAARSRPAEPHHDRPARTAQAQDRSSRPGTPPSHERNAAAPRPVSQNAPSGDHKTAEHRPADGRGAAGRTRASFGDLVAVLNTGAPEPSAPEPQRTEQRNRRRP